MQDSSVFGDPWRRCWPGLPVSPLRPAVSAENVGPPGHRWGRPDAGYIRCGPGSCRRASQAASVSREIPGGPGCPVPVMPSTGPGGHTAPYCARAEGDRRRARRRRGRVCQAGRAASGRARRGTLARCGAGCSPSTTSSRWIPGGSISRSPPLRWSRDDRQGHPARPPIVRSTCCPRYSPAHPRRRPPACSPWWGPEISWPAPWCRASLQAPRSRSCAACGLGHGDGHRQHAGVVVSPDVLGVQALARGRDRAAGSSAQLVLIGVPARRRETWLELEHRYRAHFFRRLTHRRRPIGYRFRGEPALARRFHRRSLGGVC
jgi:hypothetical protein